MRHSFRSRPLAITAVQWDGSNLAEIQALTAGHATVTANGDGSLTVAEDGIEDRTVQPSWWVSLGEDGLVGVHSERGIYRVFEAAA